MQVKKRAGPESQNESTKIAKREHRKQQCLKNTDLSPESGDRSIKFHKYYCSSLCKRLKLKGRYNATQRGQSVSAQKEEIANKKLLMEDGTEGICRRP